MSTSHDFEIKIDSKDPKTSFLANSSPHSFTGEDGILWPTVEHYYHAKKFEGTLLADKIRKASTPFQARRLARQNYFIFDDDGIVSKRKIYGDQNTSYHLRQDWSTAEPKILEDAIKAKFHQHPRLLKKLKETIGFRIVDPRNPYTGPILEKIRDEVKPETPGTTKDVKSARLSEDERKLVNAIIELGSRIRELEGQKFMYPEILEDAIYNLVVDLRTPYSTPAIIDFQNAPNLLNLSKTVHKILDTKDTFQKHQTRGSEVVTWFLKWFRFLKNVADKDTVWERVTNASTSEIVLPEVKRWWRLRTNGLVKTPKQNPVKVKTRSLSVREDATGYLKVSGPDLNKYKTRLLALGGKLIKPKTPTDATATPMIKLDAALKRFVDDMIIQDGEAGKRDKLLYSKWINYKLEDFLDTADQLVEISDAKHIDTKILNATFELYSVPPPVPIPPTATRPKIPKSKVPITKKAKAVLESWISTVVKIESIPDFDTYAKAMDRANKFAPDTPTTDPTHIFHTILYWAEFISGLNPKMRSDIKYKTAFLMLCPRSSRSQAKRYVSGIDQTTCVPLDNQQETLKTLGLNIKLPEVLALLDGDKNHSVKDSSLIAAALYYIITLIRTGGPLADIMVYRLNLGGKREFKPKTEPPKPEPTPPKPPTEPTTETPKTEPVPETPTTEPKPEPKPESTTEPKPEPPKVEPAPEPIVPPKPSVEQIQAKDTLEHAKRGAMYIRLFKPHNLSPEDYSKLVSVLEHMSGYKRGIWLKEFRVKNPQNQKTFLSATLSVKN